MPENRKRPLEVNGRKIALALRPFEIKTIRLKP